MKVSNRHDTIEQMIQQEEELGTFYKLCSAAFPELRSFWLALSKAEESHAEFLRKFASLGAVDSDRFDAYWATLIVDLIRKRTAEIPNMPLRKALECTRHFENMLLEKRLFDVVQGDSAALREMLERLQSETEQHRALAEEKLAKLGMAQPSVGQAGG